MRHVDPHVTLPVDRDPFPVLPPVDIRRRVARRLAEEGDDAIVRYLLVLRREGDPRRIYKRQKNQSYQLSLRLGKNAQNPECVKQVKNNHHRQRGRRKGVEKKFATMTNAHQCSFGGFFRGGGVIFTVG